MNRLRIFLCWLSVILVAIGLVAGLREMTWYYTELADQMEYVLGSVIGMLAYVVMLWGIYGVTAAISRLLSKKPRRGVA